MKIDKEKEERYLKSKFNDKWNDFIDDEKGEYEIKEIYYIESMDKFALLTDGRYIKIKLLNNELKEKLKNISIIKGKKNDS